MLELLSQLPRSTRARKQLNAIRGLQSRGWIECCNRMSIHKALRLTQRRAFVSSLFGITFFAAVLTVSASNILPCPVRPNRGRYADTDSEGISEGQVIVVKRPRRWIEEKHP